ncbi:c5b105de-5bf2-4223-99d3-b9484872129b [Thermothielavioides terrestris]|uniref:C5b105de-5bf2-4223-99d3-b9484872129b n=1 Tax=Thermothielavioides terrestris TaxID=2587410 RepID=A0A3S4D9X2_9PEZI|nr:c5b105de-5bf2-4223-99d3-b9484872129b [Thermothielavioides terrestris]
MPLSAAPRSVSDATRFTATTPHASSKAAAPPPPPRFSAPKSANAAPVPPGPAGGGSNGGPSRLQETPEQKVARLRAAHQRAKAAQVSALDKVIGAGRRLFDSAHRVAVVGLVGFTVFASLATAYTAFDMIRYNRKRTAEWVEAQKKIEADSLEAARIAYMTNQATEEQIALVEEQLERERETGRKTSFFSKLPSVLSNPEPANQPSSSSSSAPLSDPAVRWQQPPPEQQQQQSITETVSWPGPGFEQQEQQQQQQEGKTRSGLWNWLTGNLKREEDDPRGRSAGSR